MRYEGSAFYDDDQVFGAYATLRAHAESANDTLERPLMRELLGDVRGQEVVDLGCGTADFGLELLAAGAASYLGVDGSRNMVERAAIALRGTPARVVRSELHGQRVTRWMGADVVKYHRTVEDHFLALQAAGFTVESVRESRPVRANFRTEETFLRRQRIPLFLFMAGRKASA